MYRVTRKQKIVQNGNVIEFEDSCDAEAKSSADRLQARLLINEIHQGYHWYGEHKVIFESPTFYRSVQVAIEEIK